MVSRNLTRDLSRDVGLLLTPGDRSLSAASTRALVDAVGRLQEWLPTDRSGRPFEASALRNLAGAKWALPRGVAQIELAGLAGQAALHDVQRRYGVTRKPIKVAPKGQPKTRA